MPRSHVERDPRHDPSTATWVELAIRIGILAVFLYWSFVLIQPFTTIAIWAVVLTVALYPAYDRLVKLLGGRRRLAATALTICSLLIVIGPATWLVLGLIDSVRTVAGRLDASALALPPPPIAIKSLRLIGEPLYQLWELASINLGAALAKIGPQLKPLASTLLRVSADAGTGVVKFFIAIIVAGFLFSPAPAMVDGIKKLSKRIAGDHGETLLKLAVDTVRAVSRGVIGISVLQALLVALGLVTAGVPGVSLITSAVLIFGIVQIGPSIIIIPLIIWSWWSMETTSALLFTAYMIPVNLLDNVLRPFFLGRGLNTPIPVILIGVLGGTISGGLTGLFLGPIVLAVTWNLLAAWISGHERAAST